MVIESTGGIHFAPSFASFGGRLLGYSVDMVVTNLLLLPGIAIVVAAERPIGRVVGVLVALIGLGIATVWSATSVAATGGWLGNRVAKTKVVKVSGGDRLTRGEAAARFLARSLISPVFLFGFIMALRDPQRRAFHDELAGSIVTGRERATWSIDDEDQ